MMKRRGNLRWGATHSGGDESFAVQTPVAVRALRPPSLVQVQEDLPVLSLQLRALPQHDGGRSGRMETLRGNRSDALLDGWMRRKDADTVPWRTAAALFIPPLPLLLSAVRPGADPLHLLRNTVTEPVCGTGLHRDASSVRRSETL